MTDGGDVDLDAIRRSGGVNEQVLDEVMSTRGRSRQGHV
jgi:hypothetical protein